MTTGEFLHLRDRILLLHRSLDAIAVRHAFGGAIALAYYAEPRATHDLDLNIFCEPPEAEPVLDALVGLGISVEARSRALARRDGQVRLRWDTVPVDLFFSTLPIHTAMLERIRQVPFSGVEIPILAPEHLVACKAIFNRPKDWVDIEAVFHLTSDLDEDEIRRWVAAIADGEVLEHLEGLLRSRSR